MKSNPPAGMRGVKHLVDAHHRSRVRHRERGPTAADKQPALAMLAADPARMHTGVMYAVTNFDLARVLGDLPEQSPQRGELQAALQLHALVTRVATSRANLQEEFRNSTELQQRVEGLVREITQENRVDRKQLEHWLADFGFLFDGQYVGEVEAWVFHHGDTPLHRAIATVHSHHNLLIALHEHAPALLAKAHAYFWSSTSATPAPASITVLPGLERKLAHVYGLYYQHITITARPRSAQKPHDTAVSLDTVNALFAQDSFAAVRAQHEEMITTYRDILTELSPFDTAPMLDDTLRLNALILSLAGVETFHQILRLLRGYQKKFWPRLSTAIDMVVAIRDRQRTADAAAQLAIPGLTERVDRAVLSEIRMYERWIGDGRYEDVEHLVIIDNPEPTPEKPFVVGSSIERRFVPHPSVTPLATSAQSAARVYDMLPKLEAFADRVAATSMQNLVTVVRNAPLQRLGRMPRGAIADNVLKLLRGHGEKGMRFPTVFGLGARADAHIAGEQFAALKALRAREMALLTHVSAAKRALDGQWVESMDDMYRILNRFSQGRHESLIELPLPIRRLMEEHMQATITYADTYHPEQMQPRNRRNPWQREYLPGDHLSGWYRLARMVIRREGLDSPIIRASEREVEFAAQWAAAKLGGHTRTIRDVVSRIRSVFEGRSNIAWTDEFWARASTADKALAMELYFDHCVYRTMQKPSDRDVYRRVYTPAAWRMFRQLGEHDGPVALNIMTSTTDGVYHLAPGDLHYGIAPNRGFAIGRTRSTHAPHSVLPSWGELAIAARAADIAMAWSVSRSPGRRRIANAHLHEGMLPFSILYPHGGALVMYEPESRTLHIFHARNPDGPLDTREYQRQLLIQQEMLPMYAALHSASLWRPPYALEFHEVAYPMVSHRTIEHLPRVWA